MNARHIEANERGITLSKSLAWTLIVGLVTGGFWMGSSLTSLQTTVNHLTDKVLLVQADRVESRTQTRNELQNLQARMNAMEIQSVRSIEALSALTKSLARIEQTLSDIDHRLRAEELNR